MIASLIQHELIEIDIWNHLAMAVRKKTAASEIGSSCFNNYVGIPTLHGN